jgi:CDP-diacylglycerol--glycerol-3-phosphate 3-phosphatidyltransferase
MDEMAKFLSVSGRAGMAKLLDPAGAWLVGKGVSPNAVTVAGTVIIVAGAVVFVPRGQLLVALIIITIAAFTDLLDGAMARARGNPSRFGALLDSTMDRIADGAIFASLAYWLAVSGDHASAAAALVCLVAAGVVSYVKSRAESLGARCNVGLAERAERLVVVGAGALLSVFGVPYALPVAVWLLAVASLATVVQRIWHVRAQLDAAT